MSAILFDLDGTLVDSLQDLADSSNAVVAEIGAPTHPLDAYRFFIGDGARDLVARALPPAKRDAHSIDAALAALEKEYASRWNVKSRPYAGILELLAELVRREVPMAVLSNKPDPFTQQMVHAMLPGVPFVAIRGALPNVPKKPDPTAALALAATLGHRPEDCLFVGDSNVDIQTGVTAGMRAIGVSWGFRPVEELRRAGAIRIIDEPSELLDSL